MEIKNWKMDIGAHVGLECQSPADMYSVLENHGIISDPYYGVNETSLFDFSRMDCRFYTSFELSEDELAREHIVLSFYGLDTICDIYLNGERLDSVKNMHRMYEYDIKAAAKKENSLVLEFSSPVEYFYKMENAHHLYMDENSTKGASHLRKAFYMSGWDWAPRLPNMGIFRPVTVECYDFDKIGDVEILQHHENGEITVEISALTKHASALDGDLYLVAELDGQKIDLGGGRGQVTVKNPRLWWPNGYGEQHLYNLKISLYKGEELLDVVSKKIGLREIKLCRENDEWGQEFCFSVNGVKIFAMGANYVPMDSLRSRMTPEKTERLIKDSIFANFNCVRVWGGAFYPDDYFYDYCDKYGLIVWQDFMMACANVWLRDEWKREFTEEAIYNIKRIRHHASLGLLCGNNEMEEAVCNWPCADGGDPYVREDYLALYEEILPTLCLKYAPQLPYTPSSPTSGGGFDFPNDFARGDVHFWDVWNGGCGFEEYRKHKFRFCSEYGFESLPSIKTIDAFCPPNERNLLSYTMEMHQKHYHGNEKILRFIAEQYRMPCTLEQAVYASQLNQATAMKYGVEHFRRCRGYTMGSVYWQLNDCWPVASWSSVDYFGRYKALHYFARRFYAPLSVALFLENGKATVSVANEKMNGFEGYVLAGVAKNDLTRVYNTRFDFTVGALSSSDVGEFSVSEHEGRSTFVFAELYNKDGELIASTTELFVKPKHFEFSEPRIEVSAKKVDGVVYLSLVSKSFAKSVEVSFGSYDLQLSDNYFDLFSDTPRTILVKTDLSAEELLDDISIMSVYDIGR